ncbi:MAG: hypothetical protein K1X94_31370 [Sandaracinaceae bacterium]|nr:hypothetical protein [Sandaracinaceae bacterium]
MKGLRLLRVFGVAVGEGELAVLGRSRRELGRDNTELHAMIARLSRDGVPLRTHTFDGVDSALAQTAAYDGGALYVGGTEGWLQNPSGRSLFTPGHPFLVRIEGGNVQRLHGFLPPTTGHAELRAVGVGKGTLLLGGHENGPITHTADADRSLVRSDAWFAIRSW